MMKLRKVMGKVVQDDSKSAELSLLSDRAEVPDRKACDEILERVEPIAGRDGNPADL